MKTLTFKKFLKYSLACICATCAIIAGVFAMSENKVKAEVLQDLYITAPELNYDSEKNEVYYTINNYLPYSASTNLNNTIEHKENFSVSTQVGATVSGIEPQKKYISDIYTAYFLRLRFENSIASYKDVDYKNSIGKNFYFGSEDKKNVFNTSQSYELGTSNSNLQSTLLNLNVENLIKTTDYYLWVDIIKSTKKREISGVYNNDVSITITQEFFTFEEEIVYTSDNYKTINLKNDAISFLKDVNSNSAVNKVNKFLSLTDSNIKATDDITVNLSYKKTNGFANIETVNEPFIVKGRYVYNSSYIKNYAYNVLGYTNVSDFNVVYTDSYMSDGSIHTTQDRVFLQAESLDYSFNSTQNVGTINVVYAPFKYSNFVIRITNNDFTNNLTIDYFTSNVVNNGTTTVLTYDFETIETQLYNSAKWMFDIKQDDFTIVSAPNVTTSLSDTSLRISFNNANENNLSNLSVKLVTEIIPDYELDVIYSYASLDEKLNETINVTSPVKIWYSQVTKIETANFNTLNYTKEYYNLVTSAVKPQVLSGQDFYIFDGITKDMSADGSTCNVIINYKYKTLLKVTDSLSSKTSYISLDSNSLTYTYDDLPFNVPTGYRIKSVRSNGNVIVKFSEHTPKDLTVTINENTAQRKIITLTAELSDKWYVTVNYLERYKLTPFAVHKTLTKEVKVSDCGDIKNITADQTASIVGKKSLNVLKSTVEGLEVQYDGNSTYTITPRYTYLSLKTIDYNGFSKEIKVPLTCYEDYCEKFGQNWSILYLNSTKYTYFEYSNSVDRDKLYGYFNVAVFDKQVSDFNALFEKTTGDGALVVAKSTQVVGSEVYQFANDMSDSLLFGAVGYGLMTFCEVANDDNRILDTYFFFLDINTNNHYISNGGADNRDDDDTGGENFGEDVVGGIKDGLNDASSAIEKWWNENPFAQFLKILGWVIVGAIVVWVVVWAFTKLRK